MTTAAPHAILVGASLASTTSETRAINVRHGEAHRGFATMRGAGRPPVAPGGKAPV